ncbi:cytochrome P450 [Conidiobolus coronatus NRRL 28638]|uniref:Cytochrome P450 n=1 Tax=Conidiobolus coronatus (strain ATCC 28846 / CBS 209.66 / NRRL 28638) TaxID=796925 RepID=A0A137PI72_CONC2|nr:cytochrome P450 [Conidiobolus coronatus NRRL 28638]|eukprot:KXN74697.1 cytochrome P450 [Conidiobolus coronatus NRRL 28638]
MMLGKMDVHLDLVQRYGSIVHVKDNMVLVQNPNLKKHYMTYKFAKHPIYKLLDISGPNLFSSTDKDFHASRKKLIAPAFSIKSLSKMESTIYRAGSDSLIKYLHSQLDKNESKEIDFYPLFNSNTMDIITELIFGESLNTTWDKSKSQYYSQLTTTSGYNIFLKAVLPFYKPLNSPIETFKPRILENIKIRRESTNVHYDILQSLIDAEDPETGGKLSDLEIFSECIVLLFAGIETTSTTLTWTLYEILKHPEVYKLVADEVLEKFSDLNNPVSISEAKTELKYLEAAILESMRINPVVTGALLRVVPEGGITVEGCYLPENTTMSMDSFAQHMDPALWKSPETYDISRWLGSDREKNKSLLFTWGFGPTSCVGRELAWAEIFLVLVNLLRNFNFELVDKTLTHYLTFMNKPKEKRFRVRISRRVR